MIYTIGHSTRREEDFLRILKHYSIELLVDVRTIPRSRRNPQFEQVSLKESLPSAGIEYLHAPDLGGLRKPDPQSTNTAWENPGFRGYADHMQTERFERSLTEILNRAKTKKTALMCAEAFYGKCHRMLLSDAITIRNVPVHHILDEKQVNRIY